MRRLVLVLVLALAGCAQHTVWAHRDPALSNDQQLARDFGECSAQAQTAVGATGQAAIALNPYAAGAVAVALRNQREMCLAGRGWRVVEE